MLRELEDQNVGKDPITFSDECHEPQSVGHPPALMLPARAADTTVHVRGIRAVLEVVPAGRRQSGLKRHGPLLVGPGETEHLIRGKAKIT